MDASKETATDSAPDADAAPGADGPITKPDGPITKPDGPITKPDGPITKPDGPITKPDGPIKIDSLPPDIFIKPDATQCPPPVGCYYYKLVGSGCIKTPYTAGYKCDDKDPCTTPDKCDGKGKCVGTPIWCKLTSGSSEMLRSVWGSSASSVWAVGHNGTILHYNGSKWTKQSPCSNGVDFFGVWGTGPTNVFTVSFKGVIDRYNGTKWTCQNSGTTNTLWAVTGTSPTSVYAVGEKGTVVRYNGSKWSVETSGSYNGFYTAQAWNHSGYEYVVAAGYQGNIYRRSSSTSKWIKMMGPSNNSSVMDIWGPLYYSYYSVGQSGNVYYAYSSSWSKMNSSTTGQLNGVWGFSHQDIYAVGVYGRIIHYDGNKSYLWKGQISGTSKWLYDVWGPHKGDIFAVGQGGTILRYRPKP